MNSTGIKRVMESFDVNDGVPARIKELKTINLRSNGNQSVNCRNDEITFDVGNELIKIKEYKATAINGFFAAPEYDGDKKISFITTTYAKEFPFRRPKVGDTVAAVRYADNVIASSAPIATVFNTKVILSKKLDDIENCYFTYIDSEQLENASNDIFSPRVKVIYTPITSFKTDIYIGFNAVVGFSTRSEYAGI